MQIKPRAKKRVIILGVNFFIALIVCLVIFFINFSTQSSSDLTINYNERDSVDIAQDKGISFLEEGEIILLKVGDGKYRVGRVIKNHNDMWSARRLEYVFKVKDREFSGITELPANQSRLIWEEFESVEPVRKKDIQFFFDRNNWHMEDSPHNISLRNHGNIVATEKIRENFLSYITTTVTNESDERMSEVNVSSIAYDEHDNIVGIGGNDIGLLESGNSKNARVSIGNIHYTDIKNVEFFIVGIID